ncbi:MAG TPA: DUF4112 domain-containing protein [Vitreimonas sp.]|uniref:DUF4112 domain-containing protein n=1 Tax=Vitreimonas sp. TaxID=3069702 RepID=UPI002D393F4A|nr:DUF4112 domain-containing protein [Vitreimonas sp.]HYD86838.1 DUF4112 domain-containing protein [Vitreimonas sp.]
MAGTGTTTAEIIEPRRWRDAQDVADLEHLARLLDSQFVIPGTKWRFGLDSIVGLIPGVGDIITTALGGYIVYRARELGAPGWLIARMVGNLAIDGVFGAIPLVGDVFDFAFRANRKNVLMLLQHLEKQRAGGTP